MSRFINANLRPRRGRGERCCRPGRGPRRAPALLAGAPAPAPRPRRRPPAGTPRYSPPAVVPGQAAEPRRELLPVLPGRKWLKRGAFAMHGVICARCKQAAHGRSRRLSAPSCSPSLSSRAGSFRPGSASDRPNPGIFTGLKNISTRSLTSKRGEGRSCGSEHRRLTLRGGN